MALLLCEIIGRLTVGAGLMMVVLAHVPQLGLSDDIFKAGVFAFVVGAFPAVQRSYNLFREPTNSSVQD